MAPLTLVQAILTWATVDRLLPTSKRKKRFLRHVDFVDYLRACLDNTTRIKSIWLVCPFHVRMLPCFCIHATVPAHERDGYGYASIRHRSAPRCHCSRPRL